MKQATSFGVPWSALTAAPDFTVETITDYQSFLDLEDVWTQVQEEARCDNPFVTYEWMRTWWEAFGRGKELCILLVKQRRDPVAVAPLMLDVGRLVGMRVRCLESIQNAHTPRFDFLVSRSADEVYGAIWKHLLALRPHWDVLQLNQLPKGSRTLEEFPRLAEQAGVPYGIWHSNDSPYLALSGDWESYLATLDSKHRSNLRNRLKRLGQIGTPSLSTVTAGPDLDGMLEEGLRIEAAAWKGKAGTAICCQPELRQFYSSLARRFAARGWVRLQFLNVGDRRAAFAYSICYRGKSYLVKIGYDPEFSVYSPFNLLCRFLLRDAFEEGLSEFDFLGESMDWKLRWAREQRPHYWLYIFPNALRSRLLHSAKFRLIPLLKSFVPLATVQDALGDLVTAWVSP